MPNLQLYIIKIQTYLKKYFQKTMKLHDLPHPLQYLCKWRTFAAYVELEIGIILAKLTTQFLIGYPPLRQSPTPVPWIVTRDTDTLRYQCESGLLIRIRQRRGE